VDDSFLMMMIIMTMTMTILTMAATMPLMTTRLTNFLAVSAWRRVWAW
jgi:hypothetical protein